MVLLNVRKVRIDVKSRNQFYGAEIRCVQKVGIDASDCPATHRKSVWRMSSFFLFLPIVLRWIKAINKGFSLCL